MTESVFHHLTLYSLSSFGDTPLPYKIMLGIPTPYKEVCTGQLLLRVIPTKQTLGKFVPIG